MFPDANQFASEDADVLVGLLGHGWVALGAFGRLLDEVLGFLLRGLELLNIAIELSDVLAHEGIAFALLWRLLDYRVEMGCGDVALSYLLFWRGLPQETFDGLHSGQSVYLDAHSMVLEAPDARCLGVGVVWR